MSERTHSAFAYAILLLTCTAGVAHLTWWAACTGACGLVLLSLYGRQLKGARDMRFNVGPSDLSLALSSTLNGSAAAMTAFLLGKISAWMWGFQASL